MANKTLTTENGAPVNDNQHSQRAGAAGPTLMQDHHLLEKLAHFNRERIPERVVHAVATGAYGTFEVTNADAAKYTAMKLFAKKGNSCEVFARFSTVAGSKGAADTARDPRGFALKFYTEDGNWDLVGNNTPIFFIRDGIKFPDFIHSQKYDPYTNRQEPNNIWDFFSNSPEATHQFTWLFGDRGIPASLARMNGYGSHTFQWVNAEGKKVWVKFHLKTDQGIDCLTSEKAAELGGQDPAHLHKEFYDRIEGGDFPSWTMKVQVMPVDEAADYRHNPFDLTKVWPHEDYPLIEVGRMTLNRLPENYFAEVEQSAFSPGNFVPGVGPSPDPMLQARLFGYGDAHRYRLGVNASRLPVNMPKASKHGLNNYSRDGSMRFDDNGKGSANYEPNSRGGPQETGAAFEHGDGVTGSVGQHGLIAHQDDDDFVQAGALYHIMPDDAKERLVQNLAGSLAQVTLDGVVERSVSYFHKADSDLGERLKRAIAVAKEK